MFGLEWNHPKRGNDWNLHKYLKLDSYLMKVLVYDCTRVLQYWSPSFVKMMFVTLGDETLFDRVWLKYLKLREKYWRSMKVWATETLFRIELICFLFAKGACLSEMFLINSLTATLSSSEDEDSEALESRSWVDNPSTEFKFSWPLEHYIRNPFIIPNSLIIIWLQNPSSFINRPSEGATCCSSFHEGGTRVATSRDFCYSKRRPLRYR